ncbi:hypothetical protein BDV97DRAFT_40293 [Delphinella strobiligena]|nr:hypothetical protein BDV97DRAFT_40293 [Delphinella strobiligena]
MSKMANIPDDIPAGQDNKSLPWYKEAPTELDSSPAELLLTYSGMPEDQIIPHICKIRDAAWGICPCPCIGCFRFLDPSLSKHPLYQEVLARLKPGQQKHLDLGCCFGQDIRRLVYDGVPSENCYGSDLEPELISLGYDLFLDRNTLKSTFMAADVLDPYSRLKELEGQIDIIHTAAFFHVFDLNQQKEVCRRVVQLLKPQKDSLLLGRHFGNVNGRELVFKQRSMYFHNVESWKRMWTEIGDETQTQWDVHAELLEDSPDVAARAKEIGAPEGSRRLSFSVRRL